MILKFDEAPCTNTNPEIFFPDPSDLGGIFEAKTICSECSLINKCLTYAIDESLKYGIFGGMTPPEREREQKRRQNARYKQLIKERQGQIA